MPLLVECGIELRRPTAGRSSASAMFHLIRLDRNRRPNPAFTQVSAIGSAAVRLVRQHSIRSRPSPATTEARHLDRSENRRELRAVPVLTGGNHDRQGLAALFAGQMRLGGPPAPRTTQGVVVRFGLDPAGWLTLEITVFAGSSGVLVGPCDRRVDAHVPRDLTGSVGQGLQRGQDLRPHPGALPPAEQSVDRLPRSISCRHLPPRCAGADAPPDSVDELAFRPFRWTAGLLWTGQQRRQPRPLGVGQVRAPLDGYAGHEVSGIQGFAWSLNPDTGDFTHSVVATLLLAPSRFKITFETRPRTPPGSTERRLHMNSVGQASHAGNSELRSSRDPAYRVPPNDSRPAIAQNSS